jgi:hypothetical protein
MTKRCRTGCEEVFVVWHTHSAPDHPFLVLCEDCDGRFFTSQENHDAVKARGMTTLCLPCAKGRGETEGMHVAGKVRGGKVIRYGEENG